MAKKYKDTKRVFLVLPRTKKTLSRQFVLCYDLFPLIYIAKYLSDSGHSVQLFDCQAKGVPYQKVYDEVSAQRPDAVVIYSTTFMRFEALDMIRSVRDIHPTASIIVCGGHFHKMASEALEKVPEIDVILHDIPEESCEDLINALDDRSSWNTIEGISFRQNGNEVHTPGRGKPKDFSRLNFDMGYFIDLNYYIEPLPYSTDIACLGVETSRGCQNECIFCEYSTFNYWRRPVNDILDEVEYLLRSYPIKGIRFTDRAFSTNLTWVNELCDEIERRKLKFQWYAAMNSNIPLQLLERLRQCGLYSLSFGVESGSFKILKLMKKPLNIEHTLDFAKKCHELGIKAYAFFMYSFPDETQSEIEESHAFARKIIPYLEDISWTLTMIFPKTVLEEIARTRGVISEDFDWFKPYVNELSDLFHMIDTIPAYRDTFSVDDLINFYGTQVALKLRLLIIRRQWRELVDLIAKSTIWELILKNILKNPFIILRYLSMVAREILKVSRTQGS